ncbi:MAG: carbohydrate-binding domain-containing protein [Clostridia bacterium]|nr:carbohydrate-binding domain-containing protein [Clostridia bacterium]
MKKYISLFIAITFILLALLTSCGNLNDPNNGTNPSANSTTIFAPTSGQTSTTLTTTVDSSIIDIPDIVENVNTLVITSKDESYTGWEFSDNVLTFSNLSSNTVCSITGEFCGQIVIDAGEYKFELELNGVTLYSKTDTPISIKSGDKVTITAKKDSENFVYDNRDDITNDEEACSYAIWSKCDLEIAGKGNLTVISNNNKGIHSKKDINIKNLTLNITCNDNAIKGDDSVSIESGTLTLIAKKGDGIVTENTDISKKGNQRGIISIKSGTVIIYAACDGIDASYDVDICDGANVQIYTDSYSPYSLDVDTKVYDKRFIRFTSSNYKYSIKYYNDDNDYMWVNATFYKSVSGGRTSYHYYSFDILENYKSVQIFIYSSSQAQGQDTDYLVMSDYLTWNDSYDTFALEQRGSSLTYNWTNYTTNVSSGFGPGGMMDGNRDKLDHSAKGIKAGNEIHVLGGIITISAGDDAIHANSGNSLDNGNTSTGIVKISSGTITIISNDDGIHADSDLIIDGGTININKSYEGLEGTTITINDGDINIVSSDDGINAQATSGTGIYFNGGNIYVYAGGDGLDANSRTQYKGIIFNGSNITVISTTSMNSSIDTEQGYTYNSGSILAICPSGGMSSEATKCQNFSSVATKSTMSLKSGQILNVKVGTEILKSVEMPCNRSAIVIYLGSNKATFS